VNVEEFQQLIWEEGRKLHREMPWRQDTRAYYVLVSELMLQQTQVDRVVPKFEAFVARFPDEVTLAEASLGEVLALWSGLGYNRRAKFLHEAAKMIVADFGGALPDSYEKLVKLPGVGANTAGAILAYAFNQPVVFIETNVRTVYFNHFFVESETVTDAQLREVVANTLDHEHPREFYQAIMDYGTWLKRQGGGRLTQSHHYKKQAPLKGSVREVRGQILKLLTQGDRTYAEVAADYETDARFTSALTGLLADGLVERTGEYLHLTK
jgi:A/G-specific adenine glycosylase